MKQIIIDYDEYLKLEKAKKQVESIKEELKNGALVIERRYSHLCLETKLEYCFKLTDGLQSALKEISDD